MIFVSFKVDGDENHIIKPDSVNFFRKSGKTVQKIKVYGEAI